MNDAKSAVASLESEKQKLEQAVANAQKTLGNDHVKQDPNKKTTTSVADAQKTVTEVSHDYQSQVKAINDAVSKIEQRLSIANNGSSVKTITSGQVVQAMDMNSEPNAKVTLDILNNVPLTITPLLENKSLPRYDINVPGGVSRKIDGDFLRATYTNLHNSTYNGNSISKIVITFSNSKPYEVTQGDGKRTNFLSVLADPVQGIFHATDVVATYEFYDASGNKINFDDNAWFSVNSLNSWNGKQGGLVAESVKGLTGTTGFQLDGSSIKIHNDGWAYADFNNYAEGTSKYPEKEADNGNLAGKGDASTADGSRGWDFDNSPYFFYGSVVYKLSGNKVSFEFGKHTAQPSVDTESNDSTVGGGAWAAFTTTIPSTILPTVTYSLNDVTVTPDTVNYHYDNFTPYA
ncbi:GbpC/Spa domain-containing protein, partial [Ligilactobacillus equi]|uniref:GbpC/Spa domain-containing protein n=1 Tax=Ligilactobacillus equi TaxID=137357 RepID=UPI000AACFA23